MTRRFRIVLPVLLLLLTLPEAAHACAVCFDPREENRLAFLATTVFMSVVPIGMVGALGMWLRKRARELKRLASEDEHGRASSSGDSRPR